MQDTDIFLYEELKYYRHRFITLVGLIGLTAIIYALFPDGNIASDLMQTGFVLTLVTILSVGHYLFVLYYPDHFTVTRKLLPLFADISLLTYVLVLFGRGAIYLFALYVLIVMSSAFRFGTQYFYTSISVSALSWALLLVVSSEWYDNSDFIATFALLTFLFPYYFLDYLSNMQSEREALSRKLDTMRTESSIDPLTGAANRKAFDEACRSFVRKKEPFALMYLDLNDFKPINDTYGHDVGDAVLQYVASTILSYLSEEDVLARLGGDEFVILLSRKRHQVKAFVETLERNLIGEKKIANHRLAISVSIGIALYPENATDPEKLTQCADKAMYRAKKGKKAYHRFCEKT